MRRLGGILAVILCMLLASSAGRGDSEDHFALLMVWMPGLCKLEPDRVECKDLTLRRYDGRNLAFMALQVAHDSGIAETFCFTMPSDSEMDRSRRWCDMDKPNLRPDLASQLRELMPVSRSCQDRGLWSRYGSCTLYSADDYYSRGLRLAKDVSITQVNAKVVGAAGATVSQQVLVAAFQAEFGDEAANAVDFICRKVGGRSHLVMVKFSLTVRGLTRGLGKEYLWTPSHPLRRSCPDSIIVDAPPGAEPAAPATVNAAPSKPAAPAKPDEPPVPESVPVSPVETAPLQPPEKAKSFPIPNSEHSR